MKSTEILKICTDLVYWRLEALTVYILQAKTFTVPTNLQSTVYVAVEVVFSGKEERQTSIPLHPKGSLKIQSPSHTLTGALNFVSS